MTFSTDDAKAACNIPTIINTVFVGLISEFFVRCIIKVFSQNLTAYDSNLVCYYLYKDN